MNQHSLNSLKTFDKIALYYLALTTPFVTPTSKLIPISNR